MKKMKLELRAEIKELKEKRAELYEAMNALITTAEKEVRALTSEETEKFDSIEKEIDELDKTIERQERARKIVIEKEGNKDEIEAEKRAETEEKEFEKYLRANGELRADINMTTSDNGAVIPTSISNKIIEAVEDICPIYELSDVYRASGKLTIPYYDESTNAIEVSYANEFDELTSSSGKFTNIELSGFLAGCLTKVARSLVNNSKFDIVSFVVRRMSISIAKFIERELLKGTDGKIEGLSKIKNEVEAASATKISADELIELQEKVSDVYQANAIWIMNKATRTAIRKLKDSDGRYLLNPDPTSKWGYTLFGKPVFASDNMPTMAAGATTIYYGDMKGLAVELSEDISIQILKEKFATAHADGVVGWLELDAKVQNEQMLAKLKQAAA